MVKNASENAREKLIASATELIRRNGYVATTVDEICAAAGVTKGAFFHHFASKEVLAETCLDLWRQQFAELLAGAPFQSVADPVERLVAAMDFFIRLFSNPQAVKSCLAGTVAQETSESNPVLRKGAASLFYVGRGAISGITRRGLPSREVEGRYRVACQVVDRDAARLVFALQGVGRRFGCFRITHTP